MARRSNYRSPAQAAGVGLIEVMIAVLIMAIGMLGIAAMQATALRNSQSSLERSQIVIHTYAITDAMRANTAAARNGAYDMGETCASPGAGASLASRDIDRWLTALQDEVGSKGVACGTIACVDALTGPAQDCTVTVKWDDSRGNDGNEAQTIITETRI